MKITAIQADNFLRLNLFSADTADQTVHLFAGDNEAGKSSVQEAVRFALTGETVRVTKKGDYKLMVRDGAKSGNVSLDIDGTRITRDIKTSKFAEGEELPSHLPETVHFCLNAQKFASMKPENRRAFLIDLTGTQVEPDDIARRMQAKGVHNNCIEHVKPMLRSSLTAAHTEAMERATTARSKWCGLTGNQRYGSRIAADWKPELPADFDPEKLKEGLELADKMRADLSEWNIEKGRHLSIIEGAKKAQEIYANNSLMLYDEKEYDKTQGAWADSSEKMSDLMERRRTLTAELEEPEGLLVKCPCCDEQVRAVYNHGLFTGLEKYQPLSEKKIDSMKKELESITDEINDTAHQIEKLDDWIKQMDESKAINELNKDNAGDIEEATKGLAIVEQAIAGSVDLQTKLALELNQLIADEEKIKSAEDTTSKAQALHRAVKAWEKCSEVLAPDGIPAEILSETLKPVNNRLRNTANVTGWPQVTISPTMEIIVEQRRYSLLSESAQWRADVAIVDAISYLSSIGLMIIDRMDVLDLGNRALFMKWINSIESEYETIFIFATLKQKPNLPKNMMAHWIENGEIKTC